MHVYVRNTNFGHFLSPIRPRFEFVNLQCFTEIISRELKRIPRHKDCSPGGGEGGGGVLPYMCRCEGYDFQAVYTGIRYINQRVWV